MFKLIGLKGCSSEEVFKLREKQKTEGEFLRAIEMSNSSPFIFFFVTWHFHLDLNLKLWRKVSNWNQFIAGKDISCSCSPFHLIRGPTSVAISISITIHVDVALASPDDDHHHQSITNFSGCHKRAFSANSKINYRCRWRTERLLLTDWSTTGGTGWLSETLSSYWPCPNLTYTAPTLPRVESCECKRPVK